jgi:hypothetical protein
MVFVHTFRAADHWAGFNRAYVTTVTKNTSAFEYRICKESSVGIATGYGLDGQDSNPAVINS